MSRQVVTLTAASATGGFTFTLPNPIHNAASVSLLRVKISGLGSTPHSITLRPKFPFVNAEIGTPNVLLLSPTQVGTTAIESYDAPGRPLLGSYAGPTSLPLTMGFEVLEDENKAALTFTFITLTLLLEFSEPPSRTDNFNYLRPSHNGPRPNGWQGY